MLLAERHLQLRQGYLFAVYVAAYTFGRFWVESLRIDFAHTFGGLRLNDWTSIVIFVVAVGFVAAGLRPQPGAHLSVAERADAPAQPTEQ